jgi:erythromycin esterase-like protein
VRPAMAFREETMKRRVKDVVDALPPGTTLVLMSHAFHLAKDDADIERQGVGPGGDRVPSLGQYIVQELGLPTRSVWMLYGGGEDAQPLIDLPRTANYPRRSLNARLKRHATAPVVLPVVPELRDHLTSVTIGHMYNNVVDVNLGAEADAIMFFPDVSPLACVSSTT